MKLVVQITTMRIAISESTRNYSNFRKILERRCGAHCSETPRDTLLLRVPRRLGTIIAKKALFQQFSIFFNIFQHVFNIFSTCFQHVFNIVFNVLATRFNVFSTCGLEVVSGRFPGFFRKFADGEPSKIPKNR